MELKDLVNNNNNKNYGLQTHKSIPTNIYNITLLSPPLPQPQGSSHVNGSPKE